MIFITLSQLTWIYCSVLATAFSVDFTISVTCNWPFRNVFDSTKMRAFLERIVMVPLNPSITLWTTVLDHATYPRYVRSQAWWYFWNQDFQKEGFKPGPWWSTVVNFTVQMRVQDTRDIATTYIATTYVWTGFHIARALYYITASSYPATKIAF